MSRPWLIYCILNLSPIQSLEGFFRLFLYVSEALFVFTREGTQGTTKWSPLWFFFSPLHESLQHCWHLKCIETRDIHSAVCIPLQPVDDFAVQGWEVDTCAVTSTDPCAVPHNSTGSPHSMPFFLPVIRVLLTWRGMVHLSTIVPVPDTVLGRNQNSMCNCFMTESLLGNKFLGVTYSSVYNWNAETKFLLYVSFWHT